MFLYGAARCIYTSCCNKMPVLNITKFYLAKQEIIDHFNRLGINIFSDTKLSEILCNNRAEWRLGSTWSYYEFINAMLNKTPLKKIEIKFPSKDYIRYSWGEYSILNLAASLNRSAYLSHYSAMFFHNLTEQIPKSIYINLEQPAKSMQSGKLIQENIDRAFSQKPRMTNNSGIFEDHKIFLLNGKNTGRLGVEEFQLNELIPVTNIERTLIDISVRPFYSGGVSQVLNAYKLAKDKNVSINKLTALLEKINYIYPYHQVIGFYLETAGYKESQIELLNKFEIKYNFYLTYNMIEKEYSPKWKLFYPKGFQ